MTKQTDYSMTVYANSNGELPGFSVQSLIRDAEAVGITSPELEYVPAADGQAWGLRVSYVAEYVGE